MRRSAGLTVVVFGLLQSPSTRAQSGPPIHFEVASIRPSPQSIRLRTPVVSDRGRVTYNNLSPKVLIEIAWKMSDWQISGGPAWLDRDHYDVAATLPPGSFADQIPSMLQSLLLERFHLALRRETKELPAYALTIARKGPMLKPGDPGEQWKDGQVRGGILPGRLELHQMTMDGLASILAGRIGRPVVDRTPLKGIFDVDLRWTPDDAPAGDAAAGGPSLFTALEEQLGLKLVATRAPIEMLVITHVERPDEN